MIKAIRVSSSPGGVGKTTISINLAIALAKRGKRVLLVDGDPINANIAIFLGIKERRMKYPEYEGLTKEKMRLKLEEGAFKDHIISYDDINIDMLLAEPESTISVMPIEQQLIFYKQYKNVSEYDYIRDSYDFVITDTPAQYFELEQIGKLYSLALIVSTPTYQAIMASKGLIEKLDDIKIKYIFVLNRYEVNSPYSLELNALEKEFNVKPYAVLPEDDIMPRCVLEHTPACILDEKTPFSVAINNLADKILSDN